jgi:hypothetical protein
MIVSQMLISQMPVGLMSIGQIFFGPMSVGKIFFGEMLVGQMPVGQISVREMSVGKMFFGEKTWHQERERSFYLILSHKNYRLSWLSFTIQSSLSLPLSRPFSYLPNTFSSICVSRKRRERERESEREREGESQRLGHRGRGIW